MSLPDRLSLLVETRFTTPPLPLESSSLFSIGSLPELALEFLNRRQTAFQICRKRFGEFVFGNADRRRGISQCVFGNDLVLGFADDQPDTRLVIRMPQQVVNGGEIEVHLAGELRLKRSRL